MPDKMREYVSPYAKMHELDAGLGELDKRLQLSTPEAFVEWLIVGHGLSEESRQTVVRNLKHAFEGQRIKGSISPRSIDVAISIFGITICRIRTAALKQELP